MTSNLYYLFDPIQFPEFGFNFFKNKNFFYRFQENKKFFFRTIYIPFGPVCNNKEGFNEFLKHLKTLKFTKIIIDLPMIYHKGIEEEIVSKLLKSGFKKKNYIYQDEETIIIQKENFKLNSKKFYKVKQGLKNFDVIVKKELNNEELEKIYQIYLFSAKRIGFLAKKIDVFKKLLENALVSLAIDKNTQNIEGYVFGYCFQSYQNIKGDNIANFLMVMFTGLTDKGRENNLGHSLHYQLFKEAFENYQIDFIDFHGASRTKNRSYTEFKKEWGGNFYSLAGSFQKINLF